MRLRKVYFASLHVTLGPCGIILNNKKHKFIFINSVKLLLFLSIYNVKPSVKVLDLRLLVFEKVLKVIEFE